MKVGIYYYPLGCLSSINLHTSVFIGAKELSSGTHGRSADLLPHIRFI